MGRTAIPSRQSHYARLEFANTYYLAYRDLPQIISGHVRGTRALDFGCGTGRSTRFVRQLGFEVVSVDIAPEMIEHARRLDPEGDYRLIRGPQSGRFCRSGVVSTGDFSGLEPDPLIWCFLYSPLTASPARKPGWIFSAVSGHC